MPTTRDTLIRLVEASSRGILGVEAQPGEGRKWRVSNPISALHHHPATLAEAPQDLQAESLFLIHIKVALTLKQTLGIALQ